MRHFRLYLAVMNGTFRRYATYRVATAAGVFTNTVFGFIIAYTFTALWTARPGLGGYDQAQALTYVWIGQSLLAPVGLLGGGAQDEIHERIRTGDVCVDLVRPADLQTWWLASEYGRAGFELLGRGVVPLAVGALAFDLALPSSPAVWAVFLLSVACAVTVGYALRYLLALTTFWLLEGSGMSALGTLLSTFFSGMLLPLTVFPGAFGEVARVLPWAAMLQVPADVLLQERHGPAGWAGALGFQCAWAVVLLAAGRALQALATRKVVVQGG
jgi:ABC-2 type transport system permease protein